MNAEMEASAIQFRVHHSAFRHHRLAFIVPHECSTENCFNASCGWLRLQRNRLSIPERFVEALCRCRGC
jgi:hypothetical protein